MVTSAQTIMHPGHTRKSGRPDLSATSYGYGTAPLGNRFHARGDATSDAMDQASWDAELRCCDTTALVGHGLSKLRGAFIAL